MKRLLILCAALGLMGTAASAQDKKVMHCFAFTEIATATPEEWKAFDKATDALTGQIPGLTKVFHGKLSRPMSLIQTDPSADAEAVKKLRTGETVAVPVKILRRQYGVCMEFASPEALAAYAKHPAHDSWMKAYEKVRVAGTTTIDILGQ